MEPVAAIGLAAAIVQFIDYGCKVAGRVNDFVTAASSVPQSFRQIHETLAMVRYCLAKIQDADRAGAVNAKAQEALLPIIESCLSELRKLDGILHKAMPSAGSRRFERASKALASLYYDKKVAAIDQTIHKYVPLLILDRVTGSHRDMAALEPPPPRYRDDGGDALWLVPFARNASFVGRERVLAAIADSLEPREGGAQPKAAIYGLGGIGKSHVALEFCYRRRDEASQCSIYWVNAATVASFEESFRRIARDGRFGPADGRSPDVVSEVRTWLQTRPRPWLMVIDNVDDPSVFFHGKMTNDQSPYQCTPSCGHGALLFTTRSREDACSLADEREPVLVASLDRHEGLELVRRRLPDGGGGDDDAVADLLQELEYIPIAISQAIAFMLKRQYSVPQYLALYRENDINKTDLLSRGFTDPLRRDRPQESVTRTWLTSFQSVERANPRAARMLRLVSFFQHQGIPLALLRRAGEPNLAFVDAVALLKAYSFVGVDDAAQTVNTHRLVQLVTRCWLDGDPAETDRWALEAVEALNRHFPEPYSQFDADYFARGERLLPHAELVLQHAFDSSSSSSSAEKADVARAKLLVSTGRYIHWMGDMVGALSRFEEATARNRARLGDRHPQTLESRGLIGWVMILLVRDEAVSILEPLVRDRRDVFGDDDPRTIDGLSDLASAYAMAGDHARSERMQRDALARSLANPRLGPDHNDTLNCMEHLADVLDDQCEMDEAIALTRRVYDIRDRIWGPLSPPVLIVECNLAMYLASDGETAEALALYQQNLKSKEYVFGPDHIETLITTLNLAQLLDELGRAADARQLCREATTKAEKGTRRNNPSSAALLNKIQALLDSLEGDEPGELVS
ncbi:hypothetical protein CDD83_793 [Cordyceps sp. RAO-2017]|nr:hypothetical protein CDD83_793 [Cordyceps sp. RAO-2017]